METHPYNPPMVYVKPTNTMQIKQGKHVDANGKIYLPYLHEWKHVSEHLCVVVLLYRFSKAVHLMLLNLSIYTSDKELRKMC